MASRDTQSIVLTNDTLLVSGASIDLLNVGSAVGTITCNSNFGKTSQPVNLPVGGSYTFEYNQEGYSDILVDATGTAIHIIIKG